MDSLTRVLLAVIAMALCLSAAGDLGLLDDKEAKTPQQFVQPRFRLVVLGRKLFRVEAQTGRTWMVTVANSEAWIAVGEPSGAGSPNVPADPPPPAEEP